MYGVKSDFAPYSQADIAQGQCNRLVSDRLAVQVRLSALAATQMTGTSAAR